MIPVRLEEYICNKTIARTSYHEEMQLDTDANITVAQTLTLSFRYVSFTILFTTIVTSQ